MINSLCHRDYFEKGAVTMVEIFDDRVVIHNPGGLVNSVKKSDFGTKSFSRNPSVFKMLQRMDLVEKAGSGINRMRDEMLAANLPEPEFSIEGMFTVTFYRPMEFSTWLDSWKNRLSSIQILILEQINTNKFIIKSELAILAGISSTGLDNNINKLKKWGILEREGSKKTGVWKIVQKRLISKSGY